MKYCKKSTPEPTLLESFRSFNPQGTWNQVRNDACYGEIRRVIRRDQGGLCAYCELSLSDDNEQVAHFHPKSDSSGGINWALKWDNLWLACKGGTQTHHTNPSAYTPPLPDNKSCDENKGSDVVDGLVLSPDEIPLFPRIFRFEQREGGMEIVPDEQGCQTAGIAIDRVQKTIEVFNLNCNRLATARLAKHRVVEAAVKKLRETNHPNPRLGLAMLTQSHLRWDNAQGRWPSFFTLLRWRFNALAEAHLKSIAYQG